jgi:alpha-aminoadipic semialdehyde synthase
VDNLPTELPREASASFGEALLPFIPPLARCDFSRPLSELDLPPELSIAIIAHQGQLTPEFEYLKQYL